MPFVEAPGARLWYADLGSGAPVLLVHGGLFDPMDGKRFWQRPGVVDDLIADSRRLLLPDRRHCGGKTAADVAVHTWDVEADDLAAVVLHAGAGRVDVIAGSNGCSAAMRFAVSYRGYVRSLLLCWPPDLGEITTGLHYAFNVFDWLREHGPTAYVAVLDEEGVPRPDYDAVGFPFGVALLRDERARTSFFTLSAAEAARIVDATGNMLDGWPLRGMSSYDTDVPEREGIPVAVMPPQPEDAWHTRAAAEAVAHAISGAELLPGFPITPSPRFASQSAGFAHVVRGWLHRVEY